MTESLLQQAREFRQCVNAPSPHKLAAFLDSLIEFLEWAKSEPAQFETVVSRPTQRTHTLAIVAAIIKTSDGRSSERACIEAEAILAAVEERQR